MRFLGPLLLGIAGVAVLVSLGAWQLRRLEWKEDVLAHIEARIAAAPVAVPAAPEPGADQYLRVVAEGRIAAGEAHVLVSRKEIGAGWRIVAPFEADGRRLLLDRGFVRDGHQNDARPPRAVRVEGNLLWPDDRGSATPANDPAANVWLARDIDQLARELDTEPVLIVARSDTGDGVEPLPVSTEGIPNDHLNYAITWFSLAAVWAGMTVYLVWRMGRRTDRGGMP